MAPHQEELHFLLIPLMAPGHIILMFNMAKLLAQEGVTVTIITTSMNADRFDALITTTFQLPIRLIRLKFPSDEAGLPKGCESIDSLPSYNLVKNLFVAIEMLQQPMEKAMEELEPRVSCLICDKNIAWTANTARKFNIPRIIFDGMSCFTQLLFQSLYISTVYESVPEGHPFVVPNLPNKIELTKSQLPGMFNPGPAIKLDGFRERVRTSELEAYGMVINSFEEIEQRYVHEFRKAKGGKVWCVGPLSLCNKDEVKYNDKYLLKWLNSRQLGTIVYATLGSLGRISAPQFIELALGLEASNYPFILVVKGSEHSEEIERWIAEDGFEERTKGRSLLVRDWAPQLQILSHPAIGVFLTHCGWNSTLEGICAGLPLITWPLFAEQFLNEKLVVQILKIGVSVGAKAVRDLGDDKKSGVMVKRNEIHKAIVRVMDEQEEAKERRKRAKQAGEMAKKAVEKGGSSDLNLKLLIQDIKEQMNCTQSKQSKQ